MRKIKREDKMSKILVVVDMQNDFIMGSLGSADASGNCSENCCRETAYNKAWSDCYCNCVDRCYECWNEATPE